MVRNIPEVVGLTYMFDPPAGEQSDTITLRMTGRRLDINGRPGPRDKFSHKEDWSGIVPGSGPIAVTARIGGVPPGRWQVEAQAHVVSPGSDGRMTRRPIPVHRAGWSWRRWRVVTATADPVVTRFVPLVRTPAVALGSWPGLVIVGILLAIVTQSIVLSSESAQLEHVLHVSLLSVLAGAIGAKLWYILLHRQDGQRNGWAIQGLVAGFVFAAIVLLWALSVPPGPYLDATAPALLFGMAVGRIGCFLTGCCAGRPTSSRLGIWCSNRTVGARRVPVQLLESLLAAVVGAAALVTVLATGFHHGAVLVAAVAGYTLVRQPLLLLREETRQSQGGVKLVAAVAGLGLAASVAVIALA